MSVALAGSGATLVPQDGLLTASGWLLIWTGPMLLVASWRFR